MNSDGEMVFDLLRRERQREELISYSEVELKLLWNCINTAKLIEEIKRRRLTKIVRTMEPRQVLFLRDIFGTDILTNKKGV